MKITSNVQDIIKNWALWTVLLFGQQMSVNAQSQTIQGSLDVIDGPITLGTANVWDGTGSWDPLNPGLTAAQGLTIKFQDTGGWGEPGTAFIQAVYTDPDGTSETGDEYWSWNDEQNVYHQIDGYSITDYFGMSWDGRYGVTSCNIAQITTPPEFNLGMADVAFLSAKPQTSFRWQVANPDGSGGFNAQDLMLLDTSYGLSVYGKVSAASGQINGTLVTGNIFGTGNNNTLPAQAVTGNGSILTAVLGDARYLRKDSTVTVTGSFAGGIGQNLISGGTQFVSGKNNIGDNTALFIVGAGSSTSTRKNALTVSSAGNTTINGLLNVTGATTLSSTLNVAGTTSLQGMSAASSTISGNASVGGNLTVTGTVSIGGQTALTTTAGDLRYLRGDGTALRFGTSGSAQNAYSMAVGAGARARGDTGTSTPAFAFGKNAVAGLSWAESGLSDSGIETPGNWGGGAGGLAVGEEAFAGFHSIAMGPRAKARFLGIAFGEGAQAYGTGSFAVGYNSKAGDGAVSIGGWAGSNGWMASGPASLSLGYASHGLGERSISMGSYNWAHAEDSISIGYGGQALTLNSVAIGRGSIADRWGQVVLGIFNQASTAPSNSPLPEDFILIVGNGADDTNRGNAFTIKRNGNANVTGTLAVAGSITSAGHAVLTTEDATGFVLQSTLDDTVSELPTLYVSKAVDSLAIGSDALTGSGGFAMGAAAVAGTNAISFGTGAGYNEEPASGVSSVSLGHESRGAGAQAVAIGKWSWAGGANALAAGHEATAQSDNTVAIGRHVVANRWGQIVLGTFNDPSAVASNTPQMQDEIFVIGNGTSTADKGNALVVRRNGDAQLTGALAVGGDTTFNEEVTAVKSATFKAGVIVQGTRDATNPDKVTATLGNEILVPEQGDISMGDFRAGPQPAQP